MKEIDYRSRCRKVFLIISLLGMIAGPVLFFVFYAGLLSGLGAGIFILGGFSLLLWKRSQDTEDVSVADPIESRGIAVFLIISVIGIALIVCNHFLNGPVFYQGMGCALSISGALIYVFLLTLRFLDSLTKHEKRNDSN